VTQIKSLAFVNFVTPKEAKHELLFNELTPEVGLLNISQRNKV
jgi:hypothetical protein